MTDGIQQIVRVAKGDEQLYRHILELFPRINAGTRAVGVHWYQAEVAYNNDQDQHTRDTLPLNHYRMSYPDGHHVDAMIAYHSPTDTLYYYTQEDTHHDG